MRIYRLRKGIIIKALFCYVITRRKYWVYKQVSKATPPYNTTMTVNTKLDCVFSVLLYIVFSSLALSLLNVTLKCNISGRHNKFQKCFYEIYYSWKHVLPWHCSHMFSFPVLLLYCIKRCREDNKFEGIEVSYFLPYIVRHFGFRNF